MKNLHKKIVSAISIIIVLSICILLLTGCKADKSKDSVFNITPLSAETEKTVMDAVKAYWDENTHEIFDSMYYGTYNDCIVLNIIYSGNYYCNYISGGFEDQKESSNWRKNGIRFKGDDSSTNCLVYKDGKVYSLLHASANNMISIDDVKTIAKYHNEYFDSDKWREEKTYCKLTVEDNFSNIILICISHKASLEHAYDINDFKEIDIERFSNMFPNQDKLVREKLEAIRNSPNGVLEGELAEKYADVHEDCYHVFISIDLKATDKAEILDAIKKLETRDDILSVSPYSDNDFVYN